MKRRLSRGTKRLIIIVLIIFFFGGAIMAAGGDLGAIVSWFMQRFNRLLGGQID